MVAIKEVTYRHLSKDHHSLEHLVQEKIEDTVGRYFKDDDYNLAVHMDLEHSHPSSRLKRWSCEVDLFVVPRRLHIIVKKAGGNFYETISEAAKSLRRNLQRELRCRSRHRRSAGSKRHPLHPLEAVPAEATVAYEA